MKALFDLSFSRFVVPSLVRWLYVACICWAVVVLIAVLGFSIAAGFAAQTEINALVMTGSTVPELLAATTQRNAAILGGLAAPFISLAIVVGGRIAAELTIVLFSIAESLNRNR